MLVSLAGIIPESLVNGEGIRRVFFSQGCNKHCKGCHNKHTWSFTGGTLYDIDQLVTDVVRNPLLAGVTFSGGDPLCRPEEFTYFAKKLKEHDINIWCYTGNTWEYCLRHPRFHELLNNIDVLIDGRYIEELNTESLKFVGSSNQRIIDVPKSLKEGKVILYNK